MAAVKEWDILSSAWTEAGKIDQRKDLDKIQIGTAGWLGQGFSVTAAVVSGFSWYAVDRV